MKIDLLLWGHIKLYVFIFAILFVLELIYFYIAKKCNIVDRPNDRSSHSHAVLRGGGIIFSLGLLVWVLIFGAYWDNWAIVFGYLPFLIGVSLVTVVSFWDDVKPLPDKLRLCAHFIAMVLMFYNWGVLHVEFWYILLFATIICVGMINVYNFMDGINGITGGYSLVVLSALVILNSPKFFHIDINGYDEFMHYSFLGAIIVAVVVFCLFNFRSKGKAKCFAGDVGSISIAYMILFPLGKLLQCTGDFTYMIITVVYGVDAVLTIIHRIMLHENLGQAHRKHAFQIMANELRMGHVQVTFIYMAVQGLISYLFIFVVPNDRLSHWIFLIGTLAVLTLAYVLFMKKFYHLHAEYLQSLPETKRRYEELSKITRLVDNKLFEELYEKAKGSERKRMFFDMRNNNEDTSQRMLNALLPGTQVAIHRHEKTAETLVCLEGKLDEVFYEQIEEEAFDAKIVGKAPKFKEIGRFTLCPREGKHGVQIPIGMWHSIEVYEPSVIFEAKDGAYGG